MLLYLLSTIRKIERAGDSLKKIGEDQAKFYRLSVRETSKDKR